ncbi:hypothetical protein [Frigidibacter sp. MR17.24]|uniref:hypothetical protein n=1 Tax=Frigidibacter sp. MR17.24 TaxID=3127345 RepID=UPI003012D5DB
MNRIVLASALLAGLGSAAVAQPVAPTLSPIEEQEVHVLIGSADLSNLSTEQVVEIQNALYGTGQKAAHIRSALN